MLTSDENNETSFHEIIVALVRFMRTSKEQRNGISNTVFGIVSSTSGVYFRDRVEREVKKMFEIHPDIFLKSRNENKWSINKQLSNENIFKKIFNPNPIQYLIIPRKKSNPNQYVIVTDPSNELLERMKKKFYVVIRLHDHYNIIEELLKEFDEMVGDSLKNKYDPEFLNFCKQQVEKEM